MGQERVQALYLLKTGQVETVQHLGVVLKRGRATVQRWLKLYRESGLSSLREQKKSPGRPKTIPRLCAIRMDGVKLRLSLIRKELSDPERIMRYEESRTWLYASEGIKASYKVVHEVVRYKLKAKLKAPRPRSVKQNKGVEEDFKKNFTSGLELISRST